MKKLAFLFVAVAAISFASCGNETKQGGACDSICTEVETVAVEESVEQDSVSADSTVADTTVVVEEAPAVQ